MTIGSICYRIIFTNTVTTCDNAMQITFRDKKWELKGNTVARDAIKKIGLDPEAVLIVVNGTLTTDDVLLKEDDQVKLVAVVSGGQQKRNA